MKSRTDIKRFLADWAAILALLVCFIASTVYRGSSSVSTSNVVNILRTMVINAVFGIAATTTIAPDGFDMSAGALASYSAYVFVSVYLWLGQSLGMSVLICVLATLVIYQLTMLLILVYKVPDVLAACALMFIHRGIGQWYIGGDAVFIGMKTSWEAAPACTASSESFSAIGHTPWIIIIMLGCVLVAYLFLDSTKRGRYLYVMDDDKETAKLSGTDVKKYRYLAGMITTVFIAIGGILMASRGSSTQVIRRDNYLMPSLAAVFVGHTASGAEKPDALRTVMGTMLVSILENGLTICAAPFYVLPAVKGSVLALAPIAAYVSKRED